MLLPSAEPTYQIGSRDTARGAANSRLGEVSLKDGLDRQVTSLRVFAEVLLGPKLVLQRCGEVSHVLTGCGLQRHRHCQGAAERKVGTTAGKSPFRLRMSSMEEEADTTEEARRAHFSSLSLSLGLAQAKPGIAGCQPCSPGAPEQQSHRQPSACRGEQKHTKGSTSEAAPASTSQGCCCQQGPALSQDQPSPAPYRGVVLHDGVVQLVALAGSSSEEASLADIHIELLQAPIPGEIKRP